MICHDQLGFISGMQGWLSIQKPFDRFHHNSKIKEKNIYVYYDFNRFRKLIEQNSMPLHNKNSQKNHRLMKTHIFLVTKDCDGEQ